MDDLKGTATERIAGLRAAGEGRDAEWLERQLVSALEAWQDTEDDLRELREAREDY
jgi:hypothetical protein